MKNKTKKRWVGVKMKGGVP